MKPVVESLKAIVVERPEFTPPQIQKPLTEKMVEITPKEMVERKPIKKK